MIKAGAVGLLISYTRSPPVVPKKSLFPPAAAPWLNPEFKKILEVITGKAGLEISAMINES